jgi:hypothetical protein
MSDLGHGAICACPACRVYRAEQAKKREAAADLYAGKHRRHTDAELYGLVLFDLNQLNDLKVLARGLMPADNALKGDDLI